MVQHALELREDGSGQERVPDDLHAAARGAGTAPHEHEDEDEHLRDGRPELVVGARIAGGRHDGDDLENLGSKQGPAHNKFHEISFWFGGGPRSDDTG